MSEPLPHLLDLQKFSQPTIENLFSELNAPKKLDSSKVSTAALLFFEASTRTRVSFELACHRAGLRPVVISGSAGTSLEKGESVEDTILNVLAMDPDFLILRTGNDVNQKALSEKSKSIFINAGWGAKGHPTQALGDLMVLREEWGTWAGKKLLMVGDIPHSRVACSHFEAAALLGHEIGICSDAGFGTVSQTKTQKVHEFISFDEGLQWADALMFFRVQLERHTGIVFSKTDYRQQYGLTEARLKMMRKDQIFMHPGPINHFTEIDPASLADSKSRVMKQVNYGVKVRETLLRQRMKT